MSTAIHLPEFSRQVCFFSKLFYHLPWPVRLYINHYAPGKRFCCPHWSSCKGLWMFYKARHGKGDFSEFLMLSVPFCVWSCASLSTRVINRGLGLRGGARWLLSLRRKGGYSCGFEELEIQFPILCFNFQTWWDKEIATVIAGELLPYANAAKGCVYPGMVNW